MEASDTSGQASPAHSPRPKTTRKASTTRRRRRADRERRWGWVPEAVAVAALVALLVAAVVVFGQPSDDDETASPTQVTVTGTQGGSTTLDITTSTAPSTTTEPEPETTTSTAPPTTTRPPTISAGATAIGELVGCRRAEGGVKASVRVSHRQGPTSRFQVTVRLLDAAGGEFASATGPSPELAPGGTAVTDVLIEVEGRAAGSCEVVSVSPG